MSATTGSLTANRTGTTRPTSSVWRVGALASVVAAVATQLFVLVARALDVSLKVGDPGAHTAKEIPVLAFGEFALLWSLVGTVLAVALARWARNPARTFAVTTVVLTVASFGAPLSVHAGVATKLLLSLSHVVAAAIVIPVLARRLAQPSYARIDVDNR